MTSTGPRALGWVAAAGTLPYLTLKVIWLTGGDAGVTDPALLHSPAVTALNGATLVLDAVALAFALALSHPGGLRLPAWLVLLPMWVGTGLLLPVALAVLPSTLLAATPVDQDFLEPWVRPLVYGGFAWQAVFLLALFVRYARSRWSDGVAARPGPGAPADAQSPTRATVPAVASVIAAGGAATAALCAALHVVAAVRGGSLATAGYETVHVGFAAAGASGVLALVRGTPRRWAAVVAAWCGSAALFAWSLWMLTATTATGSTVEPVAGLADLTGLLGGFALAVAALLIVVPAGAVAQEPSRTSVSKHVWVPV